jgi:hypothetical protein
MSRLLFEGFFITHQLRENKLFTHRSKNSPSGQRPTVRQGRLDLSQTAVTERESLSATRFGLISAPPNVTDRSRVTREPDYCAYSAVDRKNKLRFRQGAITGIPLSWLD